MGLLGWVGFEKFIPALQDGAASPPCPSFDHGGGILRGCGKDNWQSSALDGVQAVDNGLGFGIAPIPPGDKIGLGADNEQPGKCASSEAVHLPHETLPASGETSHKIGDGFALNGKIGLKAGNGIITLGQRPGA